MATTSRSRTFFNGWPLLALPLLLAACQGTPQSGRPDGGTPLVFHRPGAATPAGPERAAPPGGPLPSTADLAADPARFKGLTGAEVTGLLGVPSFQRHDGDAEIWQYYGPASACVLDLFVYPEQGQPRVAHAELRSRATGAGNGCLAAILNGQRG